MILHFVTDAFPPTKGGLEAWTYAHAKAMARFGFEIVVHILGNYPENFREDEDFEINLIEKERQIWNEPLLKSENPTSLLSKENSRLNFLILRNLISKKIKSHPTEKHLIISNFLIKVGYLSSLVAESLHLPHIACVVGTDFSRGLYNKEERAVIEKVVKQSTKIVAWNTEQADTLRQIFRSDNILTIHPSIDRDILNYNWKPLSKNTVSLFSDSGYSYKKGTHVLLKAFDKLREENLPVSLTLCGDNLKIQDRYWNELKEYYSRKFTPFINFYNHLPSSELREIMISSDIYCSATLGEGCSRARIAALCAGMPIVTTLCGEIPDVADGLSHIRLAPPADMNEYIAVLRQACFDILNRNLFINSEIIEKWRNYFTSDREAETWRDLLENV